VVQRRAEEKFDLFDLLYTGYIPTINDDDSGSTKPLNNICNKNRNSKLYGSDAVQGVRDVT